MTITLDRPVPAARPSDSPVLAVLMTDDPDPEVLRRGAAAAQALGASLSVLLLEPRLGFTTSPALLASAARRRDEQLARARHLVAAALDGGSEVTQLRCAVSARPRSRHRAVSDAVRSTAAQLVVVSAGLDLAPSASWPEVLRVWR